VRFCTRHMLLRAFGEIWVDYSAKRRRGGPRYYAAGSCSGQSVLRSAPESGRSNSAQW
jgi:hypothetical protein